MMTPSVWSLIIHSLRLMGRTTVLLYPLLLLMLIMGFVRLPADQLSALTDTATGLGLIAVMLLVISAILAGWGTMVYQACLAWCNLFFVPSVEYQPRFDRKALQALSQASQQSNEQIAASKTQSASVFTPLYGALALIQGFFAGIGQFFVPVALGVGFQVVGLLSAIYLVDFGIQATGGIPPLLIQVSQWAQHHPNATQTQLNTYLESVVQTVTLQQLTDIQVFLSVVILGLAIFAAFATLTMFWLPLLMVWRRSILWCYWQSVCQFFRDPGRLTLLMAWIALLDLGLAILLLGSASIGNPILITLTEFLWMMSLIYRLLLLTNYVLVVTGGPQLLSLADPLSAAKDSSLDTHA